MPRFLESPRLRQVANLSDLIASLRQSLRGLGPNIPLPRATAGEYVYGHCDTEI